ncbi:beta-galactosidase [Bifidobacterium saguinibicoloris]|uniref:beta-galactosidase n=1 Tax=Bifidobacterium saguinibicoloris TaxID=2834433 RepID=UPI001C5628E7|nr:beta-galactosidase [Bifidobacterium saguinibicoloris]MBW3080159.1 beta-galactosidase [Bifidobacterium saguinibicoloris]
MSESIHTCDLRGATGTRISAFPIVDPRYATAPDGDVIGFTNRYMTLNGRPWYVVSGECQYSRLDPAGWDAELAKMAAGGVNVVSTYAFWNHHEEHEGVWDFTGRRDLRRFVELCASHGLKVIVRIGPFVHGEARNGGLPDWLYGEPYEVRSLDPGFLERVRDWYRHIAGQLEGLYFKDGGPVIAAQLDNEYMHSSAPWEMTTGTSDEWVPGGHDGVAYIDALRRIALDEGVAVPFFTATAWGGAAVPDDVLPLWGGYPYRPWLFYAGPGEHPVTDEYLYRDFNAADCPRNEEFDPAYEPGEKPYACCEMGGGMFSSYRYRFVLPMRSVDAMANIKMASGCNFLGYYLFHGGTNPIGDGVYLNESQTTKISYDFQAALGSYGQTRESYRRLKPLHRFAAAFGERLCPLQTVVPDDQRGIVPKDVEPLRWCVRSDGERGFVFICNFQDHADAPAKHGETIEVTLASGRMIRFDGVGLASGENCILPFNLDLGGVTLIAATAQPVTVVDEAVAGRRTAVFLRPEGMDRCWFRFADGLTHVVPPDRDIDRFTVREGDGAVDVVCLSRAYAEAMSVDGDGRLVFVDADAFRDMRDGTIANDAAAVFASDGRLVVESVKPEVGACVCSADGVTRSSVLRFSRGGLAADAAPTVERLSDTRYAVTLPEGVVDALMGSDDAEGAGDVVDARLRIRYAGDVGWLWCGGTLVDDDFSNGDVWEVGLREHARILARHGGRMVLTITPVKEGVTVDVESAMAARMERVERLTGALQRVDLVPVYQAPLDDVLRR